MKMHLYQLILISYDFYKHDEEIGGFKSPRFDFRRGNSDTMKLSHYGESSKSLIAQ